MNIEFKVISMEKLADSGPTLKAKARVDMFADGVRLLQLYDCMIYESDVFPGDFWLGLPEGEDGEATVCLSSELDKKFWEVLLAYYKVFAQENHQPKKPTMIWVRN